MSRGLVLSLCDLTGNMGRPWADVGFDVLCIDLQHPIRADNTIHRTTYRWADVRTLSPADIDRAPVIVFAFPPCTDLAVSGARDFAKKGLRRYIDALEVVEACRVLASWWGVPWMLENPVGRLSTAWRKPDHIFDPCDYGDPYTKKTCLWTGGGFVMPVKQRVEPTLGSAMHSVPPSVERSNIRSATPMGFARAVFQANAPNVSLRGVA